MNTLPSFKKTETTPIIEYISDFLHHSDYAAISVLFFAMFGVAVFKLLRATTTNDDLLRFELHVYSVILTIVASLFVAMFYRGIDMVEIRSADYRDYKDVVCSLSPEVLVNSLESDQVTGKEKNIVLSCLNDGYKGWSNLVTFK